MPTTTFEIPMLWNDSPESSKKPLIFTASEYIENFLWGIPLQNPTTKQSVPDRVILSKIQSAQDLIESILGIKLFKQVIVETKDFIRDEFMAHGFVKTTYGVRKAFAMNGRFNQQPVITYPTDWLTIKEGSGENLTYPQVFVLPNGYSTLNLQYLAITYSQYFNMVGSRIIPNYWQVKYTTGFDEVPAEIINVVGKLAAIALLPVIEMGVGAAGGGMFGLASQSLSLDGLSQSVSKANGGNIFGQRLKQYGEELFKTDLPMLRSVYSGIKFEVM
jgi:hypothetical protein